ncbi:hypothetical protein O181_023590 [Austropuccinia psidii MF-1]|uniref:Uncharacterized protein n=1 Tax=Austropuccinia psidii MF-1 TaxID=1389203 RepID=A0A9Q3CIT3_9BASI|nr:hypothetical protein [Austropuccinia psidii MF-1]
MKSHSKNSPPSLSFPHKSSDNLIVVTQPNDHMISNELNVPNLSLIPHEGMPVGTQPQNHNNLMAEKSLNHTHSNSRQQGRILGYMNQKAGHLDLYNPNFSKLTLYKKKDYNSSG